MTLQGRFRRSTALAAAALAAACALAPSAGANDPLPAYVPGEVIVRFAPGTSPAQRADARDDAGAKAIEGLGIGGMQLVRIVGGDSVTEVIGQFEEERVVLYAEANLIHRPLVPPNDPGFSLEWGLQNTGAGILGASAIAGADIEALGAWDIEMGDPGTIVAVMDSGADLQHPDLTPNLWGGQGFIDGVHGYDFIEDDTDPNDILGHGTHVSGTILARGNNGLGITGVAQRGQLMELKICGPYREGCTLADEIEAIDFAGDHGARVLNGSLGGPGFDPEQQSVYDAIQAHPDTLFVFSAGNGAGDSIGDDNDTTSTARNTATPVYPCAFDLPNIICVAATNQSDQRAGFSNFGAQSVDLGAPGTETLSTSAFSEFFSEDFESTFEWTNSGTGQWIKIEEPPLDSIGVTDSPGGNYAADTTYVMTSPSFTFPAGYSSCELGYFRSINLATGDTFQIQVLRDDVVGVERLFTSTNNEARNGVLSLDSSFGPGAQIQIRLTLTSAADATQGDGIHMDDIELVCFGSPSDNGYEYLQGTSMAAPHVSGAAALLFSAKPSATVSEVKAALLGSVDPVASLAGKTVSGGRLNARRALEQLLGLPSSDRQNTDAIPQAGGPQTILSAQGTTEPRDKIRPDTFITFGPGRVSFTPWKWKRVVFRFRSSEAGSAFLCKIDRKPFHQCHRKLVRRFSVGKHVLRVKARDVAGNVDRSPAVYRFKIKRG